jgi:hypothetical protein
MDVIEPIMQGYYNAWQPDQADAYRQKRQADEALYQKGLLALNPEWSNPDPAVAFSRAIPRADPYRVIGQTALGAPFMGEAAIANMVQSILFDQAASGLRYLGDTGRLPSWLGQLR